MRLNKKSFWKSLYKISVVLFLIGYNFAPSVLAIEQLSNIDKETPDQSVLVTTEENTEVLNEVPIDDSEDILPEGISDPEGIAKGVEIISNIVSRGIMPMDAGVGAYTISSTSGIWTAVSGGSNITGITTKEIRWGTAAQNTDRSGMRFDGTGEQNFDPDQTFLIGDLTHFNWPTVAGTAANGATLKITLNFSNPSLLSNPTFTYNFNIKETPNTNRLRDCVGYNTDEQISTTPCDDVITFPSAYGQEVFTIGDVIYTLKIDGFQNAYPTGTPLSKFVTEEKKDNTAYLVGHLSSVLVEKPQILITKKVQYEGVDYDANTATGPIIGVGETVNFTYIVQNSGNVKLENINVTDNKGVAVTCPSEELESGTSMTCTGSSTAVEGQYKNVGTVTGTPPTGASVTASDPAHYFGVGKIDICHAESADSYTLTSIKKTANADGHDSDSNDIIPPYGSGTPISYSGKNWNAYGESIYNNGCVIPKGTLTVKKVVTPSDDTTEFAITGSGTSAVSGAPTFFNGNTGNISGTKTVTFEVSPGTYSVTETVPTGWKEVNNTCSDIVIAQGENKECTITNTKLATLTIVKNALPSSTQEFSFTTTGTGLYNFTLTDNDDSTNPSKVFNNLQAGTYSVSENSVDGWKQTNVECTDNKDIDEIVLSAGDNVTCTFTNTKYGKISGYKLNDEDNSDTTTNDRSPVSGWTMFIDKDGNGKLSTGDISTTTNGAGYYEFTNLLPGDYDIYEAMEAGWIVLVGGKKDVTLPAGGNIENVSFVNVKQGSITVKKNVDGNGDGDLLDDVDTIGSTGWKWTLNDAEHTTGSTVSSLNPGTFTLKEVNQDNYHFVSLTCTGSDGVTISSDTATINLKSGEDVECTYTNARNLGTLIVKKVVVNDNGGTLKPEDFNFAIDGGNSIQFESDGDNTFIKYAGLSYNIVEVEANQRGYTTTYNNCTDVIVPHNGTATCIITNNDNVVSLQLVKEVVNNNGGTANAADWKLKATGPTTISGNGGVTSGTDFKVGTYTLSETGSVTGYSAGDWICTNNIAVNENNQITLALGQSTVCTIVNDDIAPKLTLTKVITKTNGGTAQPDDFKLTVGGTPVLSGAPNEYIANTSYTINEKALTGYEFVSITGDTKCPSVLGGTITLAAGDNITCTITNKDLPAQLTVIKNVINTGNDGTKSASDFTINVEGTDVSDTQFEGSETGVTVTLDQGTFEVTEVEDTVNYTAAYEGCTGSINVGETKTCTITNTGKDHKPTIEVTKEANKTSVKETGEDVIFTFTVKNTSKVDTVEITSLTDSEFGTLTGDEDCKVGTVLGVGKSCTFTITKKISGDFSGDAHKNTFTAVGKDEENNEATDSDDETITFTDVKPDITVTKTAGVTEIPETGGKVTFTFTVTNNSEEAGTIIVLTDSKFGKLAGDADCKVGTVLAGKASCSFEAEFDIPANKPGDPKAPTKHTNIFTATVKDNDGNKDKDKDKETIKLTPVPSLKLGKKVVHKYNSNRRITTADWRLFAEGDGGFNYAGNKSKFKFVEAGEEYTLSESGEYMSQFESGEWVCNGGTLNGNTLTLSADDDVTCTITNTAKPATIIVYKNVMSGEKDIHSEEEFTVNLLGRKGAVNTGKISDSKKNPLIAEFTLLSAGKYSLKEINVPDGYISQGCVPIYTVNPSSFVSLQGFALNGTKDKYYVGNGETLEFICTNDVIEPLLQIEKSNDKQYIDQYAGDEVTYTITVTAPSDDKEGTYVLNNVIVSDIAPAGFAYLSGTWTAQKNGSDITVGEPTYDGIKPATWAIGEMKEGDIVVLTYKTKISLLQEPGKYPDIAWVKGDSLANETVLGVSATDSTTRFVGTDVTVIEPIETEDGEVLGASITLPATGASTYLTLGALIMIILGTLTLLFHPIKKFKYLLLAGLMTISFLTLTTPNRVLASTDDIKVRIMQPATPTNKTSFDVGFVALDLNNNPITVECYKDSETTPFATFTASTGNCPAKVSASGTYTFYVKALSGSGVQTSASVVVDVNLGKPSPVINYSKTGNVLKFKTANDGKTEKIEIFRSEKSSFSANASTRIHTMSVSPNTEYSWTDTTAQTGTTYYYALRAVDAQGNVSSIVSDPLVVTIPATPTPVVTGTETDDDTTTPPTEGEVEEETPTEGEVAGETDTDVEDGEVAGEEDVDTEGEESDIEKTTNKLLEKWYIWVPVIILIGGAIYYVRRKKTN